MTYKPFFGKAQRVTKGKKIFSTFFSIVTSPYQCCVQNMYVQISLYKNRFGNNSNHQVSCQANLFNKYNRFTTGRYLLFLDII